MCGLQDSDSSVQERLVNKLSEALQLRLALQQVSICPCGLLHNLLSLPAFTRVCVCNVLAALI